MDPLSTSPHQVVICRILHTYLCIVPYPNGSVNLPQFKGPNSKRIRFVSGVRIHSQRLKLKKAKPYRYCHAYPERVFPYSCTPFTHHFPWFILGPIGNQFFYLLFS